MTEFISNLVVSNDHPSLPGHFPGTPIVPGVLLLDLVLAEIQRRLPHGARLIEIPSAKFYRPIGPDEAVEVSVRIAADGTQHNRRARFQAMRNATTVLEGSFVFAVETAVER